LMIKSSVPTTTATASDRLSIGRWRSAQRRHFTIVPSRVWKTNAVAPARAVPHAGQGEAAGVRLTARF
jgi:hypothetical protein